ncbi:MAG TPA: PKD domain-containing protein, partial [Candidatus Thermoplasmatota archaeon]|nr:PKD domain-containing protein [Candidatus Thermoplasmatota archaeon]
ATLPGRAGTVVGTLGQSDTTFIDNNVERGRTYYYSVASENNVGRSQPSNEEQVALVRKPGAPSELTAVGLEGEVRLTWAAPIDTGDAPEPTLRYYVSRQGGGSSRAIIIKTDIEGTTYIDRAITPGQSYTYTVTTLNPMVSDPSEPATATPKAILNKAPVALLSILPPLANAGDPVELDASQSSDIDGSIQSYLFDFGDGTDAVRTASASISHQYAYNGTFTATVIATDNRGEVSAPATAQVIIGEVVSRNVDSGLPGRVPAGDRSNAPGSQTPGIPGPSAGLLLVAVAALALALSRRHQIR